MRLEECLNSLIIYKEKKRQKCLMSVFISANIRDFEAVHKNLAVMYYQV